MSRKLYSKIVKKHSDTFKGCSSLEVISLQGTEPEYVPVPRPTAGSSQAMPSTLAHLLDLYVATMKEK